MINYNSLKIYHSFHLFIPEDGDEREVTLFSHSQADWEKMKNLTGKVWTLPTDLFDDPNFYLNNENYKKWTPEDWLQYAAIMGYLPDSL